MEKYALRVTGMLSAVVVTLFVAGSFCPSGTAWGFHFFSFLPPVFLYGAILFFIAAFFHIIFRDISLQVNFFSDQLEKNPVRSLVMVGILMITAIVLLRVRAPLLGDGFFLVKNFADALRGTSPIFLRNEPLATWWLFGVSSLWNVTSYAGFQSVFLGIEILLAVVFLVVVYYLVRALFASAIERFFAFCFLISLPYIQLFFGYIETYSFALVALCLYTLIAILSLRRKVSFLVVTIVFIAMGLSHYLTLAIFPSVVYLAIREKQSTGWKTIFRSAAAGFLILLGVFGCAGFDIDKFYASVPYSHFLPLTPSDNAVETASTSYTLFSLHHLTDIGNYVLLTCASSIILGIISIRRRNQTIAWTPEQVFLYLSLIGPVILFFVMKFDWGLAKDWDVFSSFTFLIAAIAILNLMNRKPVGFEKILSILLLVNLFITFSFVGLNSTTVPSIHRYEALLDSPLMPPSACYGATLQLVQYYHQANEIYAPTEAWERYSEKFPTDSRGYENIITNIQLNGRGGTEQIDSTFIRWTTASPADTLAKLRYAYFCFQTGNELSSKGSFSRAIPYYRKAISLHPPFEQATIALDRCTANNTAIDSTVQHRNNNER
jgi:hypothetical protein